MLPTGAPTQGAAPAGPASEPTVDDAPTSLPTSSSAEPIVEPGQRTVSVDCLATLPCRADAPDAAWRITLTSTRNDASSGVATSRIGMELEALTRDAELGFAGGSALTIDGRLVPGSSAQLDPGGTANRTVLAGAALTGRVTFDASGGPLPAVVERVSLVVVEADTPTTFDFENVPWPSDPATAVDCGNALPCTWTSPDGEIALVVEAIGLVRWHHSTRLILDWSATLDRDAELSLADSALAVTDTGKSLEYYGIDFGGTTSRGEGALSTPVAADSPVAGRTVFRRAPPETATSLTSAAFELSRTGTDEGVRWHVQLRGLPLPR